MNMIRQIKWCATILLFCASCSSDIGDKMEGKWQLQQVEAGGEVQKVDTVFYNFQTSLFMYQIYHPATKTFTSCYGFKVMETKNQVMLELTNYATSLNSFLPRTDWTSPVRRFIVEEATDRRLVLSGDDKSYVFRKF
jgi:hypothetical protein